MSELLVTHYFKRSVSTTMQLKLKSSSGGEAERNRTPARFTVTQ